MSLVENRVSADPATLEWYWITMIVIGSIALVAIPGGILLVGGIGALISLLIIVIPPTSAPPAAATTTTTTAAPPIDTLEWWAILLIVLGSIAVGIPMLLITGGIIIG
jgi:hypothetical protein